MKTKQIKRIIATTCRIMAERLKQSINLASVGPVILKQCLQNENRSRPQLALYWTAWLPVVRDNWPERLGDTPTLEDLHYRLKFWFCYTERQDLFQQRTALLDDKKQDVLIPFSAALSEIGQKNFTDYITFVKSWTKTQTGIDLEAI